MSFTLVSYKKKKHKKKINQDEYMIMYDVLSSSYRDRLLQKIKDAKNEIASTEIYSATISCIKESLLNLGKSQIEELICYGLGNFSDCKIALYQLGLLLAMQEYLLCEVLVYDPKFTDLEENILGSEKCQIISYNEKGKRKVNKTTLFFLPHCPNKLFNNVINANWGIGLNNCIVIANRLSEVLSSMPDRELKKHLPYLFFITPCTIEFEIPNNFKYSDVFNDMSLHCFPNKKLLAADENLWNEVFKETEDESLELITKSLENTKLE